MAPENIDKIFKDKFEHLSEVPEKLEWKKENAWRKLKNKTKRNNLKHFFLYSSVAVFIVAILLSVPKINEIKNQNSINSFQNEFDEYRKRQKLREIEMKLSGKEVYKNYCMNCEGLLPAERNLNKDKNIFTN